MLLGESDGDEVRFAVLVDPGRPRRAEDLVPLRGLLPALVADPAAAPVVLHAVGLAEWHWAPGTAPAAGRARVSAGRPRARVHRLRAPAVPAHGPGGDHAGHTASPARGRAACSAQQAVWPEGRYSDAGRLRRAGRDARGRGAPRGRWRRSASGRRGDLLRQPAVAAPREPDDRLRGPARVTTEIDVDGAEIEDARWFTREELRAEGERGAAAARRASRSRPRWSRTGTAARCPAAG